jgi:integrase
MRRGEILALRWRNVDLDRGALRVMESLEQTKAGIRFKAPKTDRARAITLPSFAVEELRRLKREQAEGLLRVGIRQSGDTLVCCREDGEPRLPNSLTNDFHYMMTRAKDLPRVRFHDLRHSHATQLLLEGVHPKIAQGTTWAFDHHDHARLVQPCHGLDASRRRGTARCGVAAAVTKSGTILGG